MVFHCHQLKLTAMNYLHKFLIIILYNFCLNIKRLLRF